MELGFALKGQRSWTQAMLMARAADAAPAPEIAWRLPGDATSGGFSSKLSDSARWQPVVNTVTEAFAGGLEYLGLKGKAYQELIDSTKDIGEITGPSAYAKGLAPRDKMHTAPPVLGDWSSFMAAEGYGLMGVEGDAGKGRRWVAALVGVFNDAQWRKELAKRTEHAQLTHIPKITKRAAPADLGLPKGTEWYEFSLTPAQILELSSAKSEKSEEFPIKTGFNFSILVMPDAERTWIAYGVDRGLLAAKLKQVLTGAAAQSLASRPGLEAWHTERVVSGAFWTVAELFEAVGRYAAIANKGKGKADGELSTDTFSLAMPNKGTTPLLASFTIEPGPTLWVSFVAPSQAMEDLAAGTVAVLAQFGDDL
jgi:hypothetical protein